MTKDLKRIPLEPDTDFGAVVEAVHADKQARLIERDGEALAVVAPLEDYADAVDMPKSRRFQDRLLALAGSWSDLDADKMIAEIYRWRHEAPPSPSVEW